MASYFTNGVTTLKFRNGDFQILRDSPKRKDQVRIPNRSKIPTIRDLSTAKEQVLRCEGLFYKDDLSGLSGRDSLYSFWENSDNTGVDQQGNSFLVTDQDGNTYQARFASDFDDGFRIIQRSSTTPGNQYRGSFTLIAEPSLPTLNTNLVGWWTAYDPDDNGGDLSSWSNNDPVGDTGSELDDKNSTADGVQSTAGDRPLWKTSQINGRPAVDFVSSDFLTIDGIASSFTGADKPLTLFIVVDWDVLTDGSTAFAIDNSSTANHYLRYRYESAGGTDYMYEVYDSSTQKSTGTSGTIVPAVDTPVIISIVSTGTAGSLWINGDNAVSSIDIDVGSITLDQATIGGLRDGGSTLSDAFNGQIGEILVYSAALTTQQRRAQEFRLSDMWGISLDA